MGIDQIISTVQGSGCSPFFFTSALQSVVFGEMGRRNQQEIMESNMAFKAHLQGLRAEYAKERLEEQKRFRRESFELGRQYLIQQTIAQNASRQEQINFSDFLNNYWPLAQQPYSILMARQDYLERTSVIPLTVLVAKTELVWSARDTNRYARFCEDLIEDLKTLPNVIIESAPWSVKRTCQSRVGEAMNINYIMGGIPTLIVFPYQEGETIGIETASWSFGRGLQTMNHSKNFRISGTAAENVEKVTKAAVEASIGMTRDAYMLAEYHAPAVFPRQAGEEILAHPEIRRQLSAHYADISRLVGAEEFCRLCTNEEIKDIKRSLTTNLLIA